MNTIENESWNAVTELAELDMAAREGVSMFDKVNAMSGEISLETGKLIDGFQAVDESSDATFVADDVTEDAALRRLSDFYVRNGFSPAGAMDTAEERELSSTPYLDVDDMQLAQH